MDWNEWEHRPQRLVGAKLWDDNILGQIKGRATLLSKEQAIMRPLSLSTEVAGMKIECQDRIRETRPRRSLRGGS